MGFKAFQVVYGAFWGFRQLQRVPRKNAVVSGAFKELQGVQIGFQDVSGDFRCQGPYESLIKAYISPSGVSEESQDITSRFWRFQYVFLGVLRGVLGCVRAL